jgi:hypothetical protein
MKQLTSVFYREPCMSPKNMVDCVLNYDNSSLLEICFYSRNGVDGIRVVFLISVKQWSYSHDKRMDATFFRTD